MASDDDTLGNEQRGKPGQEEFLPPLEFNSIVILLYFPALIQLGLMDDPVSGGRRENLVLARRNIDLLDLLRDRTKGNLEKEEQEFLAGAVDQLKAAYLRKIDALKM